MSQKEKVAATRWPMVEQVLWHLVRNLSFPEQSVPLVILFCKDFFTYLIHRICNGKNYQSRSLISSGSMLEFEIGSDVVSCVKSLHKQTPMYTFDNSSVVNKVMQMRKLSKQAKFVGLDCEWTNQKRKDKGTSVDHCPVALLQLATPDECFLIRLSSMHGVVPETVRDLLEDRNILKFGVAILEDAKRLQKMGISLRGAVDLRHIVKRCQKKRDVIQDPERYSRLGLDALALSILGIKLDKSLKIRCSDWESDMLTERQIAYAANDAIVSLQIFLALVLGKLESKRKVDIHEHLKTERSTSIPQQSNSDSTTVSPDFVSYVFDQKSCHVSVACNTQVTDQSLTFSDEFIKQAMSLCQGLSDLAFEEKWANDKSKKLSSQRYKVCEEKVMKAKSETLSVRKKPYYENCYLLAPDGTVLGTCDKGKAIWYVSRSLGVVEEEDPYTVRLSFEPNLAAMFERDYYATVKENRCVVCGRDDQYMKKLIIPRDYRRHFPEEWKNHLSHDMLLLCPPCHSISCNHDSVLRQKIAERYNVPISQNTLREVSSKVKSAAKALLYSSNKLPAARKRELETVLETHENLKIGELDSNRLEQIINNTLSDCAETHAAKVIEKVLNEGTLKEFIKMWREHFLETMKPGYLPPLWSTEHNLNVKKRGQKTKS